MDNSLVPSTMSTVRSAGTDQSGRTRTSFPPTRISSRREDAYHAFKGCIRARRRRGLQSSIFEQFNGEQIESNGIFRAASGSKQPQRECHSSKGYMQACSQLVLLPGSLANLSSDATPTWGMITRVVCIVTDGLSCPVCLETPIVPRMERCGHVYCFSCAIQYVKYDNSNSHKKCAVCTWVINLTEMKRVSLRYASSPKVGATVEMVMMVKNKDDSVLRFDRSTDREDSMRERHGFLYEQCSDEMYKLEEELNSFSAFKVEYADHPSFPEILPFVDEAVHIISQEISRLQMNNVHAAQVTVKNISTDAEDDVMFYQTSDGLPNFLDGLMWKCFLTEYCSPCLMPSFVNLTVLSINTLIVTESSRKRWRYLSHLPLGHSFNLLEVDLCPPIISSATIECFRDALEKRRLSRNCVLLEELHLTQLKEAAENRIPSLSDGFTLTGHAELSDNANSSSTPPNSADFVALCPPAIPNSPPNLSVSFAEVTKSGARTVVDRNRIANFSRTPRNRSNSSTSFNFAAEKWPSLTEALTPTSESSSGECQASTSSPRIADKAEHQEEAHGVQVTHGSKRRQRRH